MKYDKLENLNIKLSENQTNILKKFENLFLQYNKTINLISKNDEQYFFEKHIYDSLSINLFIKDKQQIKKIMDIGTGGGFPAVPISICFPDIEITAVDSINKKINVIKTFAQELQLKNLTLTDSRAEDLPENLKNSFDMVTSRAMAQLREILEYSIPFVKTGGYFIAYKSLKADEELINAQNALKVLNTKLIQKIEYEIPVEENPKRVLLIFKKLKQTPVLYPRKNGQIKKNPL